MPTRRYFLAFSSAAVAASVLPGSLLAQFPTEVFSNANLGAYAQGLLTEATFERHVGSVFKAFLPNRSVAYLTLLCVMDRTAKSPALASHTSTRVQSPNLQRDTRTDAASSAFDLSFSISGPALEQQSYTLDHGILGRFAAFLVPGISASGTPTCCASFNYLASAASAPVLPTPRGRLPLPSPSLLLQ